MAFNSRLTALSGEEEQIRGPDRRACPKGQPPQAVRRLLPGGAVQKPQDLRKRDSVTFVPASHPEFSPENPLIFLNFKNSLFPFSFICVIIGAWKHSSAGMSARLTSGRPRVRAPLLPFLFKGRKSEIATP